MDPSKLSGTPKPVDKDLKSRVLRDVSQLENIQKPSITSKPLKDEVSHAQSIKRCSEEFNSSSAYKGDMLDDLCVRIGSIDLKSSLEEIEVQVLKDETNKENKSTSVQEELAPTAQLSTDENKTPTLNMEKNHFVSRVKHSTSKSATNSPQAPEMAFPVSLIPSAEDELLAVPVRRVSHVEETKDFCGVIQENKSTADELSESQQLEVCELTHHISNAADKSGTVLIETSLCGTVSDVCYSRGSEGAQLKGISSDGPVSPSPCQFPCRGKVDSPDVLSRELTIIQNSPIYPENKVVEDDVAVEAVEASTDSDNKKVNLEVEHIAPSVGCGEEVLSTAVPEAEISAASSDPIKGAHLSAQTMLDSKCVKDSILGDSLGNSPLYSNSSDQVLASGSELSVVLEESCVAKVTDDVFLTQVVNVEYASETTQIVSSMDLEQGEKHKEKVVESEKLIHSETSEFIPGAHDPTKLCKEISGSDEKEISFHLDSKFVEGTEYEETGTKQTTENHDMSHLNFLLNNLHLKNDTSLIETSFCNVSGETSDIACNDSLVEYKRRTSGVKNSRYSSLKLDDNSAILHDNSSTSVSSELQSFSEITKIKELANKIEATMKNAERKILKKKGFEVKNYTTINSSDAGKNDLNVKKEIQVCSLPSAGSSDSRTESQLCSTTILDTIVDMIIPDTSGRKQETSWDSSSSADEGKEDVGKKPFPKECISEIISKSINTSFVENLPMISQDPTFLGDMEKENVEGKHMEMYSYPFEIKESQNENKEVDTFQSKISTTTYTKMGFYEGKEPSFVEGKNDPKLTDGIGSISVVNTSSTPISIPIKCSQTSLETPFADQHFVNKSNTSQVSGTEKIEGSVTKIVQSTDLKVEIDAILDSTSMYTSLDVKGPVESTVCSAMKVPLDTTLDLKAPQNTSEDLEAPLDTSLNLKPLLNDVLDLKSPLDTTLDLKTPLNDTLESKPLLNSTLELKAQLDSTVELKAPLDTSLNLRATLDTTLDLEVPLDTTQDFKAPFDTTLELKAPLDSAVELKAPIDTTLNLGATLDTTLDLEVPLNPALDLEAPLNTTLDLNAPLNRTLKLKVPLDTTQDFKAPFDTTLELKAPLDSSVELKAPLDTTLNLRATLDTTLDLDVPLNPALDLEPPLDSTVELKAPLDTSLNLKPLLNTALDLKSPLDTTLDLKAPLNDTLESKFLLNSTLELKAPLDSSIELKAPLDTSLNFEATLDTTLDLKASRDTTENLKNHVNGYEKATLNLNCLSSVVGRPEIPEINNEAKCSVAVDVSTPISTKVEFSQNIENLLDSTFATMEKEINSPRDNSAGVGRKRVEDDGEEKMRHLTDVLDLSQLSTSQNLLESTYIAVRRDGVGVASPVQTSSPIVQKKDENMKENCMMPVEAAVETFQMTSFSEGSQNLVRTSIDSNATADVCKGNLSTDYVTPKKISLAGESKKTVHISEAACDNSLSPSNVNSVLTEMLVLDVPQKSNSLSDSFSLKSPHLSAQTLPTEKNILSPGANISSVNNLSNTRDVTAVGMSVSTLDRTLVMNLMGEKESSPKEISNSEMLLSETGVKSQRVGSIEKLEIDAFDLSVRHLKNQLSRVGSCQNEWNISDISNPISTQLIPKDLKETVIESSFLASENLTGAADAKPGINAVKEEIKDFAGKSNPDEVFKDPSSFDFLIQCGNSIPVRDLRKESLYIKFDPLIGSPRSCLPTLPTCSAITSSANENGDPVTPLVKENQSDRVLIDAATSFNSSILPMSPVVKKDHTSVEEVNNLKEQVELLQKLLDETTRVHKEEVSRMEKQIGAHEFDLLKARDIINELKTEVVQSRKEKEKMSSIKDNYECVMAQFEKAMADLVSEKKLEQLNFEAAQKQLLSEQETLRGHLNNTERAFTDLHTKYESCKNIIKNMKDNEEVLCAKLVEYESALKKAQMQYETLKLHATSQLESANQELHSIQTKHQAEVSQLKAIIKRNEIKLTSLEEQVEQKAKENKELISICDELISKVGSKS